MAELESWLTPEFFEDILRRDADDKTLSVTRGEFQLATSLGDNFGSVRYRVGVDFRWNRGRATGTQSLIVKTLPADGLVRQMLEDIRGLAKETHLYGVTRPAMYRLMEEKLPPGSVVQPLTPKYFPCFRPDTIVLEELTALGYRRADRRRRLNLEHCVVALRTLAKFHAMSVALHIRDPTSMAHFTETLYTEENKGMLRGMVEPGLEVLAAKVDKWEGYQRFGDKIRKVCKIAVDRLVELAKPGDDPLLVLNHGEFWVNNMLFKYSPRTGEVVEVKLVNFHLCRYASPAFDLQYFLYTSPSEVVRAQCMDQLLEAYHSSLTDTLSTLGCAKSAVSLEQLKEQLEAKDFLGMVTTLTFLSVVLADPTASQESLEGNVEDWTNPVWDIMSGSRFRQALQKLLLYFEEKEML